MPNTELTLDDIACRFGTDKSTLTNLPSGENGFSSRANQGHGYTIFYEHYFSHLRREPINLLEIGVLDGRSLLTWKEYFPKARIYGLDIDPDCSRFADERINVFIGSQAAPEVLRTVCERVPEGFDIVIDDGSHYVKHVLASFDGLFDHVKPGGIYVIEDLHVSALSDYGRKSYNRGMDLQFEAEGNNVQKMIAFLKKVRERSDVSELTLHATKICFIQKATGAEAPHPIRGDQLEALSKCDTRPLWKKLTTRVIRRAKTLTA